MDVDKKNKHIQVAGVCEWEEFDVGLVILNYGKVD